MDERGTGWTRDEILARMTDTLVEMFELDRAAVVPEARLVEDLDLDSIDAIDMAVRMQEMTGQRVPEEALREVHTVGDVVELLVRLTDEG